MNNLKISYQHFWNNFDYKDNIFTWLLRDRYNVIIVDSNPDLIISGGGKRQHDCKCLYFSGEPYYPNIEYFPEHIHHDIGMSGFYIEDENYLRFPLYLYYYYEFVKKGIIGYDFFDLDRSIDINEKSHFCNFISRGYNGYRSEFVDKLKKYKLVDISYGQHKNISVPGEGGTINGAINKINFIRKYKFTIAFENSSMKQELDGYTTEKLIEPMIAKSLPLYWGNTRISEDFNTNSFLNIHDYENEDQFIEKIIELDRNDELYKSYFKEKLKNKNNKLFNKEYLVDMFLKKLEL